jgi:hypothetical protein
MDTGIILMAARWAIERKGMVLSLLYNFVVKHIDELPNELLQEMLYELNEAYDDMQNTQEKGYLTAVKLATAMPLPVRRSSGSLVSRPMIIATLSIVILLQFVNGKVSILTVSVFPSLDLRHNGDALCLQVIDSACQPHDAIFIHGFQRAD